VEESTWLERSGKLKEDLNFSNKNTVDRELLVA
jgi:hypothetical protein